MIKFVGLEILLVLWMVSFSVSHSQSQNDETTSASSSSSCVLEFDNCVLPRDCCPGLTCVAGDWQYTTDSTCLSPKSEALNQRGFISMEERIQWVSNFYQQESVLVLVGNDPKKKNEKEVIMTRDKVEHLVKKYYANFPKLVSRLEKKYGVEFLIPIAMDPSKKSESSSSSSHEL